MKRFVWGVISLVIGVAAVGLVIFGFSKQQYHAVDRSVAAKSVGMIEYQGKNREHVVLTFGTYASAEGKYGTMLSVEGAPSLPSAEIHPGGNPAWPAYSPSNQFSVPAGAYVTVVWHQYDSGGAVNNPYFAQAHGTIGGTETVNGKTVTGVDANNMAHTFTVRPAPGTASDFFLSVPSPVSSLGDNATNTAGDQVVTFSFIAGAKGLYAWNCEFPCGLGIGGFGAVMSTYGYMSGYLHVV
jgi:hypothetical protein